MKTKVLGVAVAFVLLTLSTSQLSAAVLSDVFDLQCALKGSRGITNYQLHVEAPKYVGSPRIEWIAMGTINLRVPVFDDTMIVAYLDRALIGFPEKAEAMTFRINRVTGAVEVNYLRSAATADAPPPPPGFQMVMDEFTETGRCTKSARAFLIRAVLRVVRSYAPPARVA
jgi:hypothetical protein